MTNGPATSDRHATLKGMSTYLAGRNQGGHDGYQVPFNLGRVHQFRSRRVSDRRGSNA